MTQDNIQQTDTPQENTEQAQYSSLEEAVFGGEGSDAVSSAFTNGEEGTTETAPEPTGQPEVSTQETTQKETQTDNDTTRYQYWQSQADKAKNDLTSMREQNQLLQNQLNLMNQQTQPQAQEKVAPKE